MAESRKGLHLGRHQCWLHILVQGVCDILAYYITKVFVPGTFLQARKLGAYRTRSYQIAPPAPPLVDSSFIRLCQKGFRLQTLQLILSHCQRRIRKFYMTIGITDCETKKLACLLLARFLRLSRYLGLQKVLHLGTLKLHCKQFNRNKRSSLFLLAASKEQKSLGRLTTGQAIWTRL